MDLDDHVCYCYHVSLRKLLNYTRRERPARPSQLSDCLGAGTGCGWCIPILKRIHQSVLTEPPAPAGPPTLPEGLPPSADQYAEARKSYIRETRPKNTFE